MKYLALTIFITLVSLVAHTQTTYTFTGNGYWTQASNWQALSIPPDTLPAGSVININSAPNDSCVLDRLQVIASGASLNVLPGSNFIIPNWLILSGAFPSLTTMGVSGISGNYALSGGAINGNGGSSIISKGVTWNVNPNPVIDTCSFTVDGSGNSNYESYLRNLLPNTLYYLRAYATNSSGTAYGNEISFTTGSNLLPVFVINRVDTITAFSASAVGVISGNLPSLTAHGFCWDTARLPTTALLTKTVSATPAYSYITARMLSLSPHTTYYVRGYATNSSGTAYSAQLIFITDSLRVPDVNSSSLTGSMDALGSINGNAAVSGRVTTNGMPITERGICWDSLANPTIAMSDTVRSGSGPGNFSGALSSLHPNTTYYVRAYARNAIGTGYGNTLILRSWMPANLDVVTYRNGDTIPQVRDSATWANLTTGAWCHYNNDSTNGSVYGKLYNFYALNDARQLAPAGWRLPTEDDWNDLVNVLVSNGGTGGRMKSTSLWMPPNTGANNSGRFSGLPGGFRLPSGSFQASKGYLGEWWSDYHYGYLFGRRLFYNSAGISQTYTNANVSEVMRTGRSVRCVKQ